jgi:hypothetical protein
MQMPVACPIVPSARRLVVSRIEHRAAPRPHPIPLPEPSILHRCPSRVRARMYNIGMYSGNFHF